MGGIFAPKNMHGNSGKKKKKKSLVISSHCTFKSVWSHLHAPIACLLRSARPVQRGACSRSSAPDSTSREATFAGDASTQVRARSRIRDVTSGSQAASAGAVHVVQVIDYADTRVALFDTSLLRVRGHRREAIHRRQRCQPGGPI